MKKLYVFLGLGLLFIAIAWAQTSYVIRANTEIKGTLGVDEDATFTKNVTADKFFGDGSGLTGITISDTQIKTHRLRQTLSVETGSDTVLYMEKGASEIIYDISLLNDIQIETIVYNEGWGPQDGDSLVMRVFADDDNRTISLLEGGVGTFAFGASLIKEDVSVTAKNTTDYIGFRWRESVQKWEILSYSKGYVN